MKKKVEPYITLDNPTREEFLKIVAKGAKGQRYYLKRGHFHGIKPGELDKLIKFPELYHKPNIVIPDPLPPLQIRTGKPHKTKLTN